MKMRLEEISNIIIAEIKALIPDLNEDSISMEKGFMEMGIESLQAIHIIDSISQKVNIKLDITALFDRPNLKALSEFIYAELNKENVTQTCNSKTQPAINTKDKISIIGMSCRFPGSANLASYFDLLQNAKCAVKKQTHNRWQSPAEDSINYFGAIDGIDEFSPDVFGISDSEASLMDPQQRLLLEEAWSAIEDAGYSPQELRGTMTGVYIGISSHDYSYLNETDKKKNIFSVTGNSQSISANRISYYFDFKGPSIAIDTACSSSLVALDAAVKDLQLGEIDLALVGGVNLILKADLSNAFKDATMLSPDGLCKTFSDQANGYVRGEGVGIIVLKRNKDAKKSNNRIYANILSTAINQDGKSSSLTAPNGAAQESAIRKALEKASLKAEDIVFHEAHGTGTSLGDPIEVLALQRVHSDRADKLMLSSVKTNIGHLEAAAGIAGVIKTALQIHNRTLFPSLHFTDWNKLVKDKVNNLEVITKATKWSATKSLIGSVSSFGFGGTNSHAILEEEAIAISENKNTTLFNNLFFTLSSNDKTVLKTQVQELASISKEKVWQEIQNSFSSSLNKRASGNEQIYFYAKNKDNFNQVLTSVLKEQINSQYFYSKKQKTNKKVSLIFTGQGSQYPKMYLNFYENSEYFRTVVDDLILKAQKYFPLNLYKVWQEKIEDTNYAQVLLFIFEYSFAKFLIIENDLKVNYVFGHSLGELTAMAIAGYLDIEDTLKLVCSRAIFMQQSAPGSMLVVFAKKSHIEEIISSNKYVLDLAANNGPELQVYSGAVEEVSKLQKLLTDLGIRNQLMPVKQAFHSKLMENILEPFKETISQLTYKDGIYPLISSVNGQLLTKAEDFSAQYWVNQIRNTTQFELGMRKLEELKTDVFIEIGPKVILSSMAQRFLNNKKADWVSYIEANTANTDSVSIGLLKSFSLGIISSVQISDAGSSANLLKTKFLKKKYWLGRGLSMETKQNQQNDQVLSKLVQILANTMRVSTDEVPVDESLIDMGADSLVLLNAVQIIKDTYQVAIPISEVFKDLNTLRKISNYICSETKQADSIEANLTSHETSPIAGNTTTQSANLNGSTNLNSPITNLSIPVQASSDIMNLLNNQLILMQNQISLLNNSGIQASAIQLSSVQQGPLDSQKSKVSNSPSNHTDTQIPSELSNTKSLEGLEKEKRGVLGNFKSFAAKEKTTEETQTNKEFIDGTIKNVNQLTQKTKEHVQKYREVLADNRVSAGFRPNTKEMIYPIHCVKAKGSQFTDLDGNEFLDFTMGFGVNLFGHSPDFINEEMKKQFDLGLCVGPQSHLAGEVAQAFCDLTGHERVAFVNSGTEAVMTAIRLARAATKKSKIVIFDGSYHGHFDGVLAKGSKNITSMPVAAGITQNTVNDVIVLEYGNEKSLEIIQDKISELAAVIVEPVQSRFPELQPKEFLKKLRAITEKNGVAFIWDEVITGFRISTGGAQAHFGIKADIASYGKILGGGMPIGAIGGSKKYMDFIDGGFWKFGDDSMPENEMTFFAGTFCKHPLAMASALATLNKLKNEGSQIINELNKRTDQLSANLNKIFTDLGVDIVVYNFGTLFRFKGNVNLDLLFTKLIEKGIYIWEGRNCFLSTAHTEQQLKFFVNAVKKSTEELIENKFYSSEKKSQSNSLASIMKTEESYNLIPAQNRFIRIEANDETSHRANNICVSAKVKGQLDVNKLQQALEFITKKRDIFKWSLDLVSKKQYFSNKEKPIDFEFINLRSINRPWKILDNQLLEISKTRFDLEKQSPMLIKIFDVVEETHLLVVVVHHAAFDGWSMTLFFEDLAQVYNLLLEGKEPALRNTLDYKEYLAKGPQFSPKVEESLLHKYLGQKKHTLFNTDEKINYEGERIVFDIELKVYVALKKWCKMNKMTPFMLLFAAFAKTLMNKHGKDTLTLGIPAANRDIMGSEVMYGNCANLVPITLTGADQNILQFVSLAKEKMIEGYQSMTFPYELLKEKTGDLFDVYFNLEPTSDLPEFNEASLLIHPFVISASEFPLMLNVTDFENYYHCELDFQKSKITDDQVLEIIDSLRKNLKEELLKIDFTQFDQSMLQSKK
jgi:acyl transferase domain-containing protein